MRTERVLWLKRTSTDRWTGCWSRPYRRLRGTFAGRTIEVHAVEMVFPLQKGFLPRQELPEGW